MGKIALVQELYRTFRERDYEKFREICTENIEWVQAEGFPGSAIRIGVDRVIDGVFDAFSRDWEEWSFEAEEFLDAGGNVIVLGYYQGVHRATGKSFRAAAAHVYDIEEEKIARFRQYTDTKVIWNAMS